MKANKQDLVKVVFVSGPYRGSNEWQIKKNIERAEAISLHFWKMGYAVICPHKNSAFMGGSVPDEIWLKGYIELLKRSDIVVMLPGWENSQGATQEYLVAKSLGKQVIFWQDNN